MPKSRRPYRRPPRHVQEHADRYGDLAGSLHAEFAAQKAEDTPVEPSQPAVPFPRRPKQRWHLWRPIEQRPETADAIGQIHEKLNRVAENAGALILPQSYRFDLLSIRQADIVLGNRPDKYRQCHEQVQAQLDYTLDRTIEVRDPRIMVYRSIEKGRPAIDVTFNAHRLLEREVQTTADIANSVGQPRTIPPGRHRGIPIARIADGGTQSLEFYNQAFSDIHLGQIALGPMQVPSEYPSLEVPLLPETRP